MSSSSSASASAGYKPGQGALEPSCVSASRTTARSRSCSPPTSGQLVSDRNPVMAYAAFVALALIWGVSFLFIKVGVQDMGPTGLVLVRPVSGAVALAALLPGIGRPPFRPDWNPRIPSLP